MSEHHVALLKEAKRLIKSGQYSFVCNAISTSRKYSYEVGRLGSPLNRCVQEILTDIAIGLEGCSTYNMWLDYVHGVGFAAYRNEAKARISRLAWIDAMIEYWKGQP